MYDSLKTSFVDFPRLITTLEREGHTGYVRLLTDSANGLLYFREGTALECVFDGGENEFVGGTVKLVWQATDNTQVVSVTLDISRDYGNTWETIAANIPNSGSYVWDVTGPGTNSQPVVLWSSTRSSMWRASPRCSVSDGTFGDRLAKIRPR